MNTPACRNMYCPAHFEESRTEPLQRLIAEHPLATIVRHGADGLVADHVPLLHVAAEDGQGHLIGHVAQANPLWQAPPDEELLLVFQGPQTYVSPNWYATKAEGGKVVPTWNYAVVHVHATLSPVHEREALLDILTSLTTRHEAAQPHPWQVSDAPSDFTDKLLAHIVGVRFEIRRMQGKWKVSQNQPEANRVGVLAGLEASGCSQDEGMHRLMRHFSPT